MFEVDHREREEDRTGERDEGGGFGHAESDDSAGPQRSHGAFDQWVARRDAVAASTATAAQREVGDDRYVVDGPDRLVAVRTSRAR